jgi:putative colanic acid biosynthesis acetyltransferase WcaB
MNIFCDWNINKNNIKGQIVTLMYRIAQIGSKNKIFFIILLPYLIVYRIIIEWLLGIEIPYKTKIGNNLIIYHGQSIVINDGTVIGNNCTLRHCTTIGNKQLKDLTYSKSPIIGNNVNIGSNVCIIGDIIIGDNVKIGAGSVVINDVPENSVVVGNPAKIIN